MEDVKVSVIIPAYNTEEYIDEMLKSVVNQTYKNIEIIVVNDGSKDDTLEHIKYWQKEDSRIVYFDIPNGGVSNARNIGLKNSSGNKIFFWDSDDVIELDAIEKCMEFSRLEDVSAVLYGCTSRVNGVNGPKNVSTLKREYRNEEIKRELIPHFIGHSFDDINDWITGKKGIREGKEYTALWRIMLDAEILKNNNLFFDTNLTLGEDTIFINRYFLLENSIGYLDECLYHLTWRETGANITSNNNPTLMMQNKIKLIKARLVLDEEGKRYGLKLHKYWEGTMVFSAIQLLIKFASSNTRDGFSKFQQYLDIPEVKTAIKDFHPSKGIKAIPFLMLKFGMEKLLFSIMRIMPIKLVNRFV